MKTSSSTSSLNSSSILSDTLSRTTSLSDGWYGFIFLRIRSSVAAAASCLWSDLADKCTNWPKRPAPCHRCCNVVFVSETQFHTVQQKFNSLHTASFHTLLLLVLYPREWFSKEIWLKAQFSAPVVMLQLITTVRALMQNTVCLTRPRKLNFCEPYVNTIFFFFSSTRFNYASSCVGKIPLTKHFYQTSYLSGTEALVFCRPPAGQCTPSNTPKRTLAK